MIPKLSDYRRIVGNSVLEEIRKDTEHLQRKKVVHINATSVGGGVAEILNTLVFLMNDIGIDTGWRTIIGSHSFFKITKGMHNALQGANWKMTENRKRVYLEYCRRNSIINHIRDHDIIVVHDPQPLGMIKDYEKKSTWIWRCHIDLSQPNQQTLDFLLPFVRQYDGVIISNEKFRIQKVEKPQFIIPPSIDPLSTKNKLIGDSQRKKILSRAGIDLDKPILAQVSRFDPWKDHLGVIRIFEKVKQKVDCQLVLMGDMAGDDPEGPIIYHKILQKSEKIPGIKVITEKNDLLVNALQKEAVCVFQKSFREGFALTVSEALWKGTPVIGTPVGGIPLQIMDGKNGFLISSTEEAVAKTLLLLQNQDLRNEFGRAGHELVKERFLITRQLHDYVKVFGKFLPLRT